MICKISNENYKLVILVPRNGTYVDIYFVYRIISSNCVIKIDEIPFFRTQRRGEDTKQNRIMLYEFITDVTTPLELTERAASPTD